LRRKKVNFLDVTLKDIQISFHTQLPLIDTFVFLIYFGKAVGNSANSNKALVAAKALL